MMPQLAESELNRLIRAAGGSYVEAFKLLAGEIDRRSALERTPKTTISQRKQSYRNALETLDETTLLAMQESMSDFVDLIHALDLDPSTIQLPAEKAVALMKIMLEYEKISEFTLTFHEMVREIVFKVITEQNAEKGEEFPEHVNGDIKVPELGKRFTKEGTGRKAPIVDQVGLSKLLGEEIWNEVCDEELVEAHWVPERVERRLNIEKLMKRAYQDPQLMPKIEQCVVPGDWKSPSFWIRDLKAGGQ